MQLDAQFIAALEEGLQQTRNVQNRLTARLRDVEGEARSLREEIGALEESASRTEALINSSLIEMRSSGASSPTNPSLSSMSIDGYEIKNVAPSATEVATSSRSSFQPVDTNGKVAYMSQHRRVPSRQADMEPVTQRFQDRTITQACTLLLRESNRPLHVNELYNLLVSGGMKFAGKNPTISIAVSLSRSGRFDKVDPGTFELAMRDSKRDLNREASRRVS